MRTGTAGVWVEEEIDGFRWRKQYIGSHLMRAEIWVEEEKRWMSKYGYDRLVVAREREAREKKTGRRRKS